MESTEPHRVPPAGSADHPRRAGRVAAATVAGRRPPTAGPLRMPEGDAGVPDGRAARGADSRARLRAEALRLFAEQGYAQTSTREICAAAGANVAAIHYYFGDKAGLYRDVYLMPIRQMVAAAIQQARVPAPLEVVLRDTYRTFLEPLKVADPATMQLLKLHFRERADPSGLVGDEVVDLAREHFETLVAVLVRELGLATADDDVRRLATSLVAIAADFLTSADWSRRTMPTLYEGAEAIDLMVERLTGYGVAMLAAERSRRRG
ncbi:MAG: TetR/AcrR family transcriptional regulator [Lautropia sp.]